MRHEAASILRDEHRSLAAVLQALQFLVGEIRQRGRAPDFRLLHAMLYYIREYPERLHHPKEDRYLFAALRRRTGEADAVLAALEAEHARGEGLLNALTVALSAFEAGARGGPEAFAQELDGFAGFYWSHMRKEEDVVLPLAEQVLSDADWAEIGTAFAQNQDPGFTAGLQEDFRQLYTRIVNLTPAPVGLGS